MCSVLYAVRLGYVSLAALWSWCIVWHAHVYFTVPVSNVEETPLVHCLCCMWSYYSRKSAFVWHCGVQRHKSAGADTDGLVKSERVFRCHLNGVVNVRVLGIELFNQSAIIKSLSWQCLTFTTLLFSFSFTTMCLENSCWKCRLLSLVCQLWVWHLRSAVLIFL